MATELSHSHRATVHYVRCRPETTALYQLVQQHVETFFAQVQAETAHGLAAFESPTPGCVPKWFLRQRKTTPAKSA